MENSFEIKYYIMMEVLVFMKTNHAFKEQFLKLTIDEVSLWMDENINSYAGDKLNVENRKLTNDFWLFVFADVSQ
ncbi:hypothetical protein [Pedobacter sp. N23S346]|uniref:hypothetical protein n=1 Tax=Pedobacter sp. N23S346 TaxID=3402750 RepID=UPI003AD697AB